MTGADGGVPPWFWAVPLGLGDALPWFGGAALWLVSAPVPGRLPEGRRMQGARVSSPLGGSPAASMAATMRPIDSARFSFSGFITASAPLSPLCCIWSALAWSCR